MGMASTRGAVLLERGNAISSQSDSGVSDLLDGAIESAPRSSSVNPLVCGQCMRRAEKRYSAKHKTTTCCSWLSLRVRLRLLPGNELQQCEFRRILPLSPIELVKPLPLRRRHRGDELIPRQRRAYDLRDTSELREILASEAQRLAGPVQHQSNRRDKGGVEWLSAASAPVLTKPDLVDGCKPGRHSGQWVESHTNLFRSVFHAPGLDDRAA